MKTADFQLVDATEDPRWEHRPNGPEGLLAWIAPPPDDGANWTWAIEDERGKRVDGLGESWSECRHQIQEILTAIDAATDQTGATA